MGRRKKIIIIGGVVAVFLGAGALGAYLISERRSVTPTPVSSSGPSDYITPETSEILSRDVSSEDKFMYLYDAALLKSGVQRYEEAKAYYQAALAIEGVNDEYRYDVMFRAIEVADILKDNSWRTELISAMGEERYATYLDGSRYGTSADGVDQ